MKHDHITRFGNVGMLIIGAFVGGTLLPGLEPAEAVTVNCDVTSPPSCSSCLGVLKPVSLPHSSLPLGDPLKGDIGVFTSMGGGLYSMTGYTVLGNCEGGDLDALPFACDTDQMALGFRQLAQAFADGTVPEGELHDRAAEIMAPCLPS